jgi:hypothetical protein
VEHSEDGRQSSDRNMQVLTTNDIYNFINVHFVGLRLSDRLILMQGMGTLTIHLFIPDALNLKTSVSLKTVDYNVRNVFPAPRIFH